jgi:hypothetical protein
MRPSRYIGASSHRSGGNADGNKEIFLASSPAAAGIPTLSEWAQIGMVALLLTGGLIAIKRREIGELGVRS